MRTERVITKKKPHEIRKEETLGGPSLSKFSKELPYQQVHESLPTKMNSSTPYHYFVVDISSDEEEEFVQSR